MKWSRSFSCVNILPCLFLLVCSCDPPDKPLSKAYVVGTYKGQYFGGVEMVVLRPDGTFSQEFKTNAVLVYTNQGKWELRPPNFMSFSPFSSIYPPYTNCPNCGLDCFYRQYPDRIEFGNWP